jgi:DegV family protein with EDD domain
MVKIVADTTCGLPREMLQSLGIPLVSQLVIFGETSYRDGVELDSAAFLQKLKASAQLPKTAAPIHTDYFPIFEEAKKKGDAVVVVAPSQKVSGTVRSATTAAQEFPGLDVRVVDTATIASNLGTLVLLANQWAQAGEDADAIVRKLEELAPRQRTYFLVDTLEYLQKGGRIGGAKALLGELLQVKPILTVRNGQVDAFEQQRTRKRALARLVEIVSDEMPKGPQSHLCVMQADAEPAARELVASLGGGNLPIYELPPAIIVHAGPGALAVGFFV